jgi:MerR family transcriptional regulator, copper efflux regulator
MDGLRISEVARRTGLSASALRFYEDAGIVTPAREANGYRSYSVADVDALGFVTRSKAVGLSLDEITELLVLRDTDRCAPLQDRLGELVAARLADTRARAAELAAFAGDLEALLGQLTVHRPDGPCDDDCGCLTAGPAADQRTPVPVALARRTLAAVERSADACSLARNELPKRLDDWTAILTGCVTVRDEHGATITLPDGTDLGEVTDLVAAETECCSFFTFQLHIDATTRTLRVSAPPEQQPIIDLLVGKAS